jgi:hypothetical protein
MGCLAFFGLISLLIGVLRVPWYWVLTGFVVLFLLTSAYQQMPHEPPPGTRRVPRDVPRQGPTRSGQLSRLDEYYKTEDWDRKRGQALRRDNFRCVACGGRAQHVHHRAYRADLTTVPVEDLVSLCWRCHSKLHGRPLVR